MPRKPKAPLPLVIESLSTGRELRPEFIISDLTGERIPVVQDTRPIRKLPMPEDIQRAKHLARLKAREEYAQRIERSFKLALDMVNGKIKAQEPEPTHAEIRLGNYIARIPLPPKKPFRRF
jgi:hypothetical protein